MDQNPYNSGSTPDTQTRSLYETIRLLILADRMELHTWLPAIVTKVYDDGFVDIQPQLKRVYQDTSIGNNGEVTFPPAQHCMVCVPRGTDYYVRVPVAVGDTGVALFCERSLDVWSQSGGVVDPLDGRIHDVSDPVFIPGLFPESDPVPGAGSTDMEFHNGGTTFTLEKSGQFKLSGAGGQELLSITSDFLDQAIALAIVVQGPLSAIAVQLGLIKARLTLIKG